MTAALRVPLVAAAGLATTLALLTAWQPATVAVLGTAATACSAALALASADRPRRTLWTACAITGLAMAGRATLPLPSIDPTPLLAHVGCIRRPLADALHALVPEPESGILLGIVLGERSSIGRDLREAFAVTGTTHLLAISGFNMTLVAGGVAFALRGRVQPPIVALATIASVAAYSVLVGGAPSVARAALMSAVGALALALGRPGLAANALAAAATAMLLADPFALEDVGFVLSVTATAGLIALQRPLAARCHALPPPLADALATTLAASLPTMPIVAAVFGRVSLVAPVANLFAVPLFPPLMLFGAATAVAGAVAPGAAAPLAFAAYLVAAALRHVVQVFAAAPLASVDVPSGAVAGGTVALLVLAGWLGAGRAGAALRGIRTPALGAARAGPPRWAVVGICCAAMLVGAIGARSVTPPSALRLHVLDVGQGDAFLLESDGRYALIDGGPDATLLLRRLGEILPPWHRRIDLVALTHEHADHGAGLLGAIERFDVGLAIEPVGMADVPLTRMWRERLARSRVRSQAVGSGAVIRLGQATLEVLGPGERRVAVPSLVIRASTRHGSVLFMGDATDDAIADLLLARDALVARVYVPPHHGADTAHASPLVAAVRPALAVISSGANNRYGHPTAGTLAALAGVPVYRTDRYGTVVLTLDAEPFSIRTTKAGLPPDRGGPVPRASPAR